MLLSQNQQNLGDNKWMKNKIHNIKSILMDNIINS